MTTNKTNKKVVKKGDVICYRSELGKVVKVTEEGVTIRGPYMTQTIDWDDVKEYNRDLFKN